MREQTNDAGRKLAKRWSRISQEESKAPPWGDGRPCLTTCCVIAHREDCAQGTRSGKQGERDLKNA